MGDGILIISINVSSITLQWAGKLPLPENCPFLGDPGPHMLLGSTLVHTSNGISISSAVLAQLTVVTSRQTNRPFYVFHGLG